MQTATPMPSFEAPGPGSWQLDATHFARPQTLFFQEIFPEACNEGFRSTTSRYGMLIDDLGPVFVNGFMYYSPRPAAEADVPGRFAAAEAAFAGRIWRDDLARWDGEAKPASIRDHLALQAVELELLDIDELLAHLARCRERVQKMVTQHHSFNGASLIPVGDFLAQASEWVGVAPTELLALLAGSAPVSAGASAELDALARAIRLEPVAADLLASSEPPGEVIARLRAWPGGLGAAAARYLELTEYRIVDGLDIGAPCGIELPETLVAAIKGAVENGAGDAHADVAERVAAARDRVPAARQEDFDGLLAEARAVYRLRDERGLFSEIWASGIARTALLEAGRRLAEAGRIDEPAHLLEAGYEELTGLVGAGEGPGADELKARAEYRLGAEAIDAPPWLNSPPEPPPPLDGLPPAAARVAAAMGVFLAQAFGDSEAEHDAAVVRGLSGSSGTYEGRARIVLGPESFDRLVEGDVLVTHATTGAFNTLLPLLGAIVTDSGGALSHAAIVAREYGIPAIVGTRNGTRLVPDGARVRVDADSGELTVLA